MQIDIPKEWSWGIFYDPPTQGQDMMLRIWRKLPKPIRVDGRWQVAEVYSFIGPTIEDCIEQWQKFELPT
jgi:hypothetical protein